MLNAATIRESLNWHPEHSWEATLSVESPLFKQQVAVFVLAAVDGAVSDRTITIIQDFLQLDEHALVAIKAMIWQDFEHCFELIDYGIRPTPGQTERAAHEAAFGVISAEDAFRKSVLLKLQIIEEDEIHHGNYGYLRFDNEWTSHFCVIVMKNGQIVGYGEDGLYVGDFETPTPTEKL